MLRRVPVLVGIGGVGQFLEVLSSLEDETSNAAHMGGKWTLYY